MRIYLDSADREAVGPLATGLFAGVTTNPSILDKSGLTSADIPDYIRWCLDAGAPTVFAQVWGHADEMIERGEALQVLSDRVVVRVPYSSAGLVAAAALAGGGRVLVTALHDARQVIPVLASGAHHATVRRADGTIAASTGWRRSSSCSRPSRARGHR